MIEAHGFERACRFSAKGHEALIFAPLSHNLAQAATAGLPYQEKVEVKIASSFISPEQAELDLLEIGNDN